MEELKILILFVSTISFGMILNKLATKYNLLLNYTGYPHQKFTKNKLVPLTGGNIAIIFIINKFFNK